jgi:hypothetical protein
MTQKEILVEGRTLLFERGGAENTAETLRVARRRAEELGIRQVVIASSHGGTALRARTAFAGLDARIVAVGISAGYRGMGWSMTAEEKATLEGAGIPVLIGIHALGDDVNDAFGFVAANRVVRTTLYRFSQGMKVAVEIALMAADAGLLEVDREAIAIAGTGAGADTAIVVKPACCRNFEDFEVREILAKPRRASDG